MKFIGTLTPILAGAVLVLSGFDASLEYRQAPETILRMHLLYSFVPAVMLLTALLLLWKYPLRRERVDAVKGPPGLGSRGKRVACRPSARSQGNPAGKQSLAPPIT